MRAGLITPPSPLTSMLFVALRCPAFNASRTAHISTRSLQRPSALPLRRSFLTSRHHAAEVTSPTARTLPHDSQTSNAPTSTVETEKAGSNSEREPSFCEKIGKPGIWRQVTFVGVVTGAIFSWAAMNTSLETEEWKQRMHAVSSVWSVKTITNADLKRVQSAALIQQLRETLVNIQTAVHQLPVLIQPWVNRAVIAVMQPYADASEAKRLCWKICLLNVAVWGAWKMKSLQPFMNRMFMHNPLSGMSVTLLTSMFSHRSAIHLLFNCLALESFGAAAYYYLLREQNKSEPGVLESSTSYHFVAFFISAGLFAGLVSHIVSAKIRFPRLVAQLASARMIPKTETWAAAVASAGGNGAKATSTKKVLDILPSLGASGAIYAAVTMTALAFPDSQVSLFIPPSYPINIQYGVGGLLLLDTIGILRGWRFFDHWAHLGGAVFGVMYYFYGPNFWKSLRDPYSKAAEQAVAKRSDSQKSS